MRRLKLLLLVSINVDQKFGLDISFGQGLIDLNIQFQSLRIDITDIHTTLVMEQNCVSITVRVDANVCLFSLQGS